MQRHILIVEDEPDLSNLLRDYLVASSYGVTQMEDGGRVVAEVRRQSFDLILLDLMLPNKDGLEICKELREFSDVPIIMLTARVEEIDRLLGLESGADDYVCKPYSPREVVARVKAVLRRGDRTQSKADEQGAVTVDRPACRVLLDQQDTGLTQVEFQLFSLLYSEPGRIFSRSQIMDRIYSDYRVVSDRTIDSHIKKIRKKLQAVNPDLDLIQSVYGVGYRFEIA